jgi:hypothetical protein
MQLADQMMAKFYNFNFGHLNDEGFTPGNKLNRTLSVQVDELNFQTISLSVVL